LRNVYFDSLDLKPKGKHCSGLEGILKEGADLLDADSDAAVLDAALVAGCQRVERYESSAYGSLIAWAKILDHAAASTLLKANEREKRAADTTLTTLAESTLNAEAAAGSEDDERATLSAPSRGKRL
jgi:ferritin-like metal-binding protein YciE